MAQSQQEYLYFCKQIALIMQRRLDRIMQAMKSGVFLKF
jgi:hypothetical protein